MLFVSGVKCHTDVGGEDRNSWEAAENSPDENRVRTAGTNLVT